MTKIYRVDYSYAGTDDEVKHYVTMAEAIAAAQQASTGAWRDGIWAEARVISITLSSLYSPEEMAVRLLDGYGYTAANNAVAFFSTEKETKYYDEYYKVVGSSQEGKVSTGKR